MGAPRFPTTVLTGAGKGKTTAALGMAMRAVGHGMRVLMIQFLKGSREPGELTAAARLAPELEIRVMGLGWIDPDAARWTDEERKRVQEAWDTAREATMSGKYDMVILDEINYVVHYGGLAVEAVVELMRTKPSHVHLVLTGGKAPTEVVKVADLVTEMLAIKHPYASGVKAQRGVEY